MPVISSFYGILILYYEANAPHQLPHFHAYYAEHEATFAINPPNLLDGLMPRRQMRLILAWAELHQDELMANWVRSQDGQPFKRIAGL